MQLAKLNWKPTKYLALCCKDVIWSEKPGQYKDCKCKKSGVEETEEYIRTVGNFEKYIEDSEEGLE
jgi:hypothetical protein